MTYRTLLLLPALVLGVMPIASRSAEARSFDRRVVAQTPTIQRWMAYRGTRMVGWKDKQFTRGYVFKCYSHFFSCTTAHQLFMGQRPAKLGKIKLFTQDSFRLFRDKRNRWAPLLRYVDRGVLQRTPHAALVLKTPGAADKLATWIDNPRKIDTMLCNKGRAGTVYTALFYLGAKKHAGKMIKAFASQRCSGIRPTQLGLWFLSRWKLASAQVKTIETFCVSQAFQSEKRKGLRAMCMRYLGRIRTKSTMAKRFIARFVGSDRTIEKREAIRAVMNLNLKAAKGQLKQNLRKAEKKQTVRVRRRRRYKSKTITGWSNQWMAVPSAVALMGMGDRYAKKAIKYWLGVTKDNRLAYSSGFIDVYREAVFASPKGRKKLRKPLAKAFKKAVRALKKNHRLKLYVLKAAIALAQMGDKAGLKYTQKVLKGSDNNAVQEVLAAFGGVPHKVMSAGRSSIGIGHLVVGKGNVSVKNALKIAKLIKSQFSMWGDKTMRRIAMQAYYDIMARVYAVKKRL